MASQDVAHFARHVSAGPRLRVLVVDADEDVRELLGQALSAMGLETDCVGSVASARALLTQRAYRLCLAELTLASGDGLALLRHAREHCPGVPMVVLTGSTQLESVVAALRAGARECLAKPVSLEALRALVRNLLDIELPEAVFDSPPPVGELIGDSARILAVRDDIAAAAQHKGAVAIHGESGSGKRLAARLIHAASARARRPWVEIDCHTQPTLAELFGADKTLEGAADLPGCIARAEGGGLLLHHVDALPAPCQLRLARMLETKSLRRPGGAFDEAIDLRVMCSTLSPLARAHAAGTLVDALYYVLDRFEISLPPLRQRQDDIAQLAEYFLARNSDELGWPAAHFADDALARLMRYPFPGNVRELECVLEKSLLRSRAEVLHADDIVLPEADEED